MTRIKMCGLSGCGDIEAANSIMPEYIGFVFAQKSKRYVSPGMASRLRKKLSPDITAIGVFVNENVETVAGLLKDDIIDIAQLHGNESDEYIHRLRELTDKPLIQAFKIENYQTILRAEQSIADMILLDSGTGSGKTFDWGLLDNIKRPYFLAGGLDQKNVFSAVKRLHPFAVDVSSGIETDGIKDKIKMAAFAAEVRKEDGI